MNAEPKQNLDWLNVGKSFQKESTEIEPIKPPKKRKIISTVIDGYGNGNFSIFRNGNGIALTVIER